jgi:peptidyl-prolyl cis-trans isomerase D
MSVIQKIRNKYIGLVVGLIVLALVGFLVMDAMQSNVSNLIGGDQTMMGNINGQRIDYKDYDAKKSLYEQNTKSRAKDGVITDEQRTQIQTQAWDDIVNDVIMKDEIEKLGLDLTDKELTDILTSPYAHSMVKQNFSDPETGAFNPAKVTEVINSLGQDKTGAARDQWKNFEDGLMRQRKIDKYNDLITKGIYVPKFVVEQTNKHQSSKSNISYVQVPYTSIVDSTVKISDADVQTYIDKHKKMFTAQEAFANVEYVSFDIIPSKEDTAGSLGVLASMRDTFMKANSNVLDALVANNSEEAMSDKFMTEKDIIMPNPTEVLASSLGTVIGPLFINNTFRMVKVLDKKSKADSVKASHVLVKIDKNRTEEQAKLIIDSFETAVKAGANLAQLATARSEDPGSAAKGGDLGYFGPGMMVAEFDDACFNGTTGDLKVVKTQFGYHLIKVTDQKAFKPAVKLAIMSKSLLPGTTTTQAAFAKANEFVGKAKDANSFTATAKAMGKDKRMADYITPTAQNINGVGNARELSRWAFDAKMGAVSNVISLDDKCVIANLTSRQEKGAVMNVKAVRPQVEEILRKEKKGIMITDKYKGKSTLEEIATMAATMVKTADSINYQGGSNPEISSEVKVIGAAFNKGFVSKLSPAISGAQGVYFIKVNNLIEGAIEKENPMMKMMQQQMSQSMLQNASQMIPYILKQKAKIIDNRGKFL